METRLSVSMCHRVFICISVTVSDHLSLADKICFIFVLFVTKIAFKVVEKIALTKAGTEQVY